MKALWLIGLSLSLLTLITNPMSYADDQNSFLSGDQNPFSKSGLQGEGYEEDTAICAGDSVVIDGKPCEQFMAKDKRPFDSLFDGSAKANILPFKQSVDYSNIQFDAVENNGEVVNLTVPDEMAYKLNLKKKAAGKEYSLTIFMVSSPKENTKPFVKSAISNGGGKKYVNMSIQEDNPSGIDWSGPRQLVQSAKENLLQKVKGSTEVDGIKQTYPIPNHGIGHIFVSLACGNEPTVLTGMTTADDLEAPVNMFLYDYGLNILFQSQSGRLNTAAELTDELVKRMAPGSVGNVKAASFLLSPSNCQSITNYLKEVIARKIHNRYGGLIDRPFNGTGGGCAPFGFSFLKAGNIMKQIFEERFTEEEFYYPWWRTIYVPKKYLMEDEKILNAEVGLLKLVLANEGQYSSWGTATDGTSKKLSFYDPELFARWIVTEYKDPSQEVEADWVWSDEDRQIYFVEYDARAIKSQQYIPEKDRASSQNIIKLNGLRDGTDNPTVFQTWARYHRYDEIFTRTEGVRPTPGEKTTVDPERARLDRWFQEREGN